MIPRSPLKADYTASHELVGISGHRPVRVSSWVDGPGELRQVPHESPEFPGWEYGDLVYTPRWQDRRPHDHDFYEICIVRQGFAEHRTDFTDDQLEPGTVVVLAPGIAHTICGLQGFRQTNIYYLAEWLSDDLSAYWGQSAFVPLFLAAALFRSPLKHPVPQFVLTPEEMRDIDHELADIGLECHAESSSLTFLKSTLLKLLIKLSRAYSRRVPEELVLGFRSQVTQALEHIEQAILQCEPFHVNELAKKIGISPNHFTSIFKQATGWAPMEYYQGRRVQHASRLLLDPQRSITDVAHDLGFFDSAHLCHLFKQYKRMSATEYRKLCSGKKIQNHLTRD
ncbi:MAG: AraC family transcriptional regulator [Candidatus Hydrogenedentes bacterium]|nr:AraC family transcriptional regulator [Candidatus Hydrogenedentota bacterium]